MQVGRRLAEQSDEVARPIAFAIGLGALENLFGRSTPIESGAAREECMVGAAELRMIQNRLVQYVIFARQFCVELGDAQRPVAVAIALLPLNLAVKIEQRVR